MVVGVAFLKGGNSENIMVRIVVLLMVVLVVIVVTSSSSSSGRSPSIECSSRLISMAFPTDSNAIEADTLVSHRLSFR